jgi:hypothetical protein
MALYSTPVRCNRLLDDGCSFRTPRSTPKSCDLEHQRRHAGATPLRMQLAAAKDCALPGAQRNSLSVPARYPSSTRYDEEQLSKSRKVRSDYPARSEVEAVRMSITRATDEWRAGAASRPKGENFLRISASKTDELHTLATSVKAPRLKPSSNVPVQRPDDVYWMLALYPSGSAATGC